MNQYVLGIDAGGTKTQGLLKCLNTGENWTVIHGPGSLTNDYSRACQNIKEVAESLLLEANCSAAETVLVCGAAGANSDALKARLEKALQSINFAQSEITTDARLSLFGAGKGKPIIVVALGTGSVAMRLDNSGAEKQFGGWGFTAGDQGGGAFIGRELVASTLQEFDKDDFQPDDLVCEVLKIIGEERQVILSWLSNVTPAKFAALSPLVSSSITNNQLAKTILQNAADEVERLILSSQGESHLPVCLIGGLAEVIFPLLSANIQAQIVPSKGNAVDGAIYLAKQLQR